MTKPQDYWVRHEHGSDRLAPDEARAIERLPVYAILDHIRSAHNVGAAFRSADGAGAVLIGRTNMTEFAYSGLGLNPATATPPNIHDAGNLAGGSSSGAGSAAGSALAQKEQT